MSNFNKNLLEKLNLLIDANQENPAFSAVTICHELAVSRSQLHRILIEETQLPISLYVRKRRLDKAKILLSTTDLRVSEVADAVGINSHANFSKYFIEEFSVSPTDFRRQFQEQQKKAVEGHLPVPNISESATNHVEVLHTKKNISQNIYGYSILAFLVMVSIGYYFISRSENTETIETAENSMAVLPFKNLGDAQKSYFSEGVMEQIHSSLASLSGLKVISTTSSNKYKHTQKSISQIAQELHVSYLLNGSVLQVENQVRITVELINAKEDRVVWTKIFEGDAKNIFGYMNTVSKEVVVELNQKLSGKFSDKLDKKPTKSLKAYNEYLQGKQLLQARTKEKIEASLLKFSNAIVLDTDFADAYSNKALAYYLMGEDQYIDVETAYKMAEKNALAAIRLDAENGRAYAVLGNIYKVHNKWEQAITTYQIALKFSPNDAQTTYWYSLTLRSIGLLDEAIKYSTKAVSLDPLAANIYSGHIIGCAYAGKFDVAQKALKDGELIFNEAHLFHNAKAFYHIKKQNYKAALAEFLICEKLNPNTIYYKTLITYTKAKLGQRKAADLYLKTMPKIPDNNKYFAIVYAGLGDKDNCLHYLELAAENSDSPNYLKTSPLFTFLHGDPRFGAVLQKLGLLNPAFSTDGFSKFGSSSKDSNLF